jgi:SulP family sulfate permease
MARTRLSTESEHLSNAALPAAALRAVFREGYGLQELRRDLLAGVSVGIIAVPLAMALAVAAGVPPQHGLYTAIVAGFFAALLGGSRFNVSGPTAAFVVVLAPIFTAFGLSGLLIASALAGCMLIAMGLMRLGQLIQFIPYPVTTGFTSGIATVIATLQLKDFFGLQPDHTPEHFVERVVGLLQAAHTASPAEAVVGALTLAVLLLSPRVLRGVPAPLVGLTFGAVLAAVLSHFVDGFTVATLGTRFTTVVGDVSYAGIPPLPPHFAMPWTLPGPNGEALPITLTLLRTLVPAAFTIAMLGAIETLLTSVVADGASRTRHDPDAELVAQGIANIISPFFGGMPATAAMSRTSAVILNGAVSPIAAMTHSVTVLVAVVLIAPILRYLPMASLAALLLVVAWNMSEVKHFIHIVRVAPRSDVTVLLTCFGLTVVFDMVVAVSVGVVLAALLFMRRMAEVTHATLADPQTIRLHADVPPGVLVYDIAGPLFFGAAQKAIGTLHVVDPGTRVAIVRLEQVPAMDATALVALESALVQLRDGGVFTILCGLQEQPRKLIETDIASGYLASMALAGTTDDALALAREHLALPPRPRTARHNAIV